jgi:hypothetical protein
VKLFVIEVGRRFYRTHYGGDAIVLPLWGRVRIEPSRMEILQGSMSSDVLWGACKPLQCNSTCNNNCLCYAAFNKFIIRALKLSRIFILYKFLKLAKKDMKERKISFITYANVDINRYKKRIFRYVIKKLAFPFILKNPWLKYNNVTYKARKR